VTTTHTLRVPGAVLHYEVRGSGPLLIVTGAPMAAAEFAPLADALARDHTVVTHDPRGVGSSRKDRPDQDSTPDLRADDLVAVMDALEATSADVFGSSGGAVTGLALASRHPDRVRTLVAHEPPLLELLPDAVEQRAKTRELMEIFRREGPGAAWMKFMINAGFFGPDGPAGPGGPPGDAPAPPQDGPSADDLADSAHFFLHELWHTTTYEPDIAALTFGPPRVVVGLGADSGRLLTYGTSTALAGLLGSPAVEFPGDHGGFMSHTEEFAEVLRSVLASELASDRTTAQGGKNIDATS
jgi:pimeloyl-ACP methyl ester carboxylesterase